MFLLKCEICGVVVGESSIAGIGGHLCGDDKCYHAHLSKQMVDRQLTPEQKKTGQDHLDYLKLRIEQPHLFKKDEV